MVAGHMIIGTLDFRFILLGFFLPDLLLTIYAVISTRRLGLLLLAPLFPFMRFIDSYVVLRSIWAAWHTAVQRQVGQPRSPHHRFPEHLWEAPPHRRPITPPTRAGRDAEARSLKEERAS